MLTMANGAKLPRGSACSTHVSNQERGACNHLSASSRPWTTRTSSKADRGCLKQMALRHRFGPRLWPTATG